MLLTSTTNNDVNASNKYMYSRYIKMIIGILYIIIKKSTIIKLLHRGVHSVNTNSVPCVGLFYSTYIIGH